MKKYTKTQSGEFVEVTESELSVDERVGKIETEKNDGADEGKSKEAQKTDKSEPEQKKDNDVPEKVADGYVWGAGIALCLTLFFEFLYGRGIGNGIMLFFFPFAGFCISLIGVIRRGISLTTRAVLAITLLVSIVGITGAYFIFTIDTGMGRLSSKVGAQTTYYEELLTDESNTMVPTP